MARAPDGVTPNAGTRLSVFVVPHTHWDREWYDDASRSRQRLAEVLDDLLDQLEAEPAIRTFLLDGQLAVVDDYLSVRPDQAERLASLVGDGRLTVGPWYVLADEFLCTDEVLVRNLLHGRRGGRRLGGWMPVGYSPDAFGHPAAFPTILSGFGIRHAIVWRGYGGEPGQEGDLFRWVAPDGAAVLAHHLPPAGYEVGAELPAARDALALRWHSLRQTLASRAIQPSVLVLNGADHHALQPDLPEALATLRDVDPDADVRVASPVDYFASLDPDAPLPEVRGELRFSYRYAWTLQGVHGARSRLKRLMAEGERLLVRWAEPQAALARMAGGRDRRPALDALWREHLLSCAHDSIGGCTSDEVARDVGQRERGVVSGAGRTWVESLHDRVGLDRVEARRRPPRRQPVVLVSNPSARCRTGVLEATVSYFIRDVPVGRPDTAPRPPTSPVPRPRLTAADGSPVAVQVLSRSEAYERFDSPRDYPDQDAVHAVRVAVMVPPVPAFGIRRLDVHEGGDGAGTPAQPVGVEGGRLVSDHLTVGGDGPSAFDVGVAGGSTLPAVGEVESEVDLGDTYTFQPVAGDVPRRANWGPVRTIWTGPLVAAVARDFRVEGCVRGTVHARLDAGSRLVRIVVEGDNLAGNHRLRVTFPVPGAPVSVADGAFGPVTRERRRYDREDYPLEWPALTAPMHRYVSVPGHQGRGVTVFARGVFEYEATGQDRLALTVFRSVSDQSRGDLPARPGHAAWPAATPEAREIGPFRAELALALTAAGEEDGAHRWDEVESLADEFHNPLAGLMLRRGALADGQPAGPALEGPGLAFKALKPAADGEAVVARCVNLTAEPVRGAWRWPGPLRRAALARLDETELDEIRLRGERKVVPFLASPREVVTILAWA